MNIEGVVFGSSFNELEKAVYQSTKVQQKIAQNIANIESDNWKKVEFDEELRRAYNRFDSKDLLIDQEMTKMAANNLKLSSYIQMLSGRIKMLNKVVTQGKG